VKPLSEEAARRGPWRPELGTGSASSYFVPRSQTRLERSDFELRLSDERQAASALEQAWARTPLRKLARPLMRLARAFRDVDEPAAVSSSFYEML